MELLVIKMEDFAETKKKQPKALYIYSWSFCHTGDCIAPLVCPTTIWMTVLCPQYDWNGSHFGEFMFAYFFSFLCSGHKYPLESNR